MNKKNSLFNNKGKVNKQESIIIDDNKMEKINKDVKNLLEVKKCKACGEEKVIYYFEVDTVKDIYTDICKECYEKGKKQRYFDDQDVLFCKGCNTEKNYKEFYNLRGRERSELCKECIKDKVKSYKHTKVCKKCGIELQTKNFLIAPHYRDYLSTTCKICRNKKRAKGK